ncbi:MAG: hypothetical protein HQ538_06900 [Parcubacteria group bacterium]|nr:hypothetical protein [Parcubacteria group bacterium]
MKKILIIEDNPNTLKELIDLFLPDNITESPDYDLTICTTERGAKELDPGIFDYILIDHDLPDRGNGGRILNYWVSCYEAAGVVKVGKEEKIIAISCIPINNERLLDLGATIAINKMDSDWLEKLKREIGIGISKKKNIN